MAQEIEHKFLVTRLDCIAGKTGIRWRQAYLSRVPERTVRVRIGDDGAFLTIKGKPRGTVRDEFEYAIPTADAEHLLAMCDGFIVDKTRYRVEHAGHLWEIDVFHGDNEGLVLAEIELEAEGERFALPPWVGPEVTNIPRYQNASLSATPFSAWGKDPE
ncbi:MAG: CYTH domain-containing protein [Nitrospiraceae bacterium]|jgi:CYTH domain-containing protein|nr:CYTH domain-containing protein [Nitrospiraceae bacterium]